ncbi:hypothetical protein RFI_27853 [Reticulomyxa filosa]|uniref:Uncharacterized protein n=1 Tax=Reticulomyxa filosa TaxID=46433 RepID=X6M7U7_RETFI|nr:hypothetical protein RFI_27853 [Reticulomyxa filosa]|eukprot:ETO09527.1 hypothetical protein RFI_27853 [Reticulomyxa filosa]
MKECLKKQKETSQISSNTNTGDATWVYEMRFVVEMRVSYERLKHRKAVHLDAKHSASENDKQIDRQKEQFKINLAHLLSIDSERVSFVDVEKIHGGYSIFGETMDLKETPNIQMHVTDFYELKTADEAIAQLDNAGDPNGEIITFEDSENSEQKSNNDSDELENFEEEGSTNTDGNDSGDGDTLGHDKDTKDHKDKNRDKGKDKNKDKDKDKDNEHTNEDRSDTSHTDLDEFHFLQLHTSEENVGMETIDSTKEDSFAHLRLNNKIYKQPEIEVWRNDNHEEDHEEPPQRTITNPLSLLARSSQAASAIRLTSLGIQGDKQVSQTPLTPFGGMNKMLSAPGTPFHLANTPFGLSPVTPRLFSFRSSNSSIGSAAGLVLSPKASGGGGGGAVPASGQRGGSLIMPAGHKKTSSDHDHDRFNDKAKSSRQNSIDMSRRSNNNNPLSLLPEVLEPFEAELRKALSVKSTPITPQSARTTRKKIDPKGATGKGSKVNQSLRPSLPPSHGKASAIGSKRKPHKEATDTSQLGISSSQPDETDANEKHLSRRLSRALSGGAKSHFFSGLESHRDSEIRAKRKTAFAKSFSKKTHPKKGLNQRKGLYSQRHILKGIGLNRQSTAPKHRRSMFFDNDMLINIGTLGSTSNLAANNAALGSKAIVPPPLPRNQQLHNLPVLTVAYPFALYKNIMYVVKRNELTSNANVLCVYNGLGFSETADHHEDAQVTPFWENDRDLYGALMSVQIIAEFMNEYKASSECRAKFMKMAKYFTRFVKNHTYHKNWSTKRFVDKAKAKLHSTNYNLHLYENYLTNQKYFINYQINLKKKS